MSSATVTIQKPTKKIIVRENNDPFDIFCNWEVEYQHEDGTTHTEGIEYFPSQEEFDGFYYAGHRSGQYTWEKK